MKSIPELQDWAFERTPTILLSLLAILVIVVLVFSPCSQSRTQDEMFDLCVERRITDVTPLFGDSPSAEAIREIVESCR